MNKKNNIIVWLVVLVVILSSGFTFCLGRLTVGNNDTVISDNNSNDQKDEEKNENVEFKNWTEYLLAQDIKRAYIYQWSNPADENGNTTFHENTTVISKDDLKEILTEMYKADLHKLENVPGGDTTPDLYVVYEVDGKEETLHFSLCKMLFIDNTSPKEFVKYLEMEELDKTGGNDENPFGDSFVVYEYQWNYESTINKILSKYKTN